MKPLSLVDDLAGNVHHGGDHALSGDHLDGRGSDVLVDGHGVVVNIDLGGDGDRDGLVVGLSNGHLNGDLLNVDLSGVLDGDLRSHFGVGADGSLDLGLADEVVHTGGDHATEVGLEHSGVVASDDGAVLVVNAGLNDGRGDHHGLRGNNLDGLGEGVGDGGRSGNLDGGSDGIGDGGRSGNLDGLRDGIGDGSRGGNLDGLSDGVSDGSGNGGSHNGGRGRDGGGEVVGDLGLNGNLDRSGDGIGDGGRSGNLDGLSDGVSHRSGNRGSNNGSGNRGSNNGSGNRDGGGEVIGDLGVNGNLKRSGSVTQRDVLGNGHTIDQGNRSSRSSSHQERDQKLFAKSVISI